MPLLAPGLPLVQTQVPQVIIILAIHNDTSRRLFIEQCRETLILCISEAVLVWKLSQCQ